MSFWHEFGSSQGFMPHGMCYLWQPGILTLHVISDALITLAYFSIPFTLLYFARKRTDLNLTWVLVCFATFIVACGSSHFMEIWTIWHPDYWLSGGVKAVTALASVPTAVLLARFVPAALRVPSPAALQAANADLAREVGERRSAELQIRRLNESLEARIAERTSALSAANEALRAEMRERRQTDELLSRTLASIRDGVIATDGRGAITFVNEAAARMIGRDPADIVGAAVSAAFDLTDPATGAKRGLIDAAPPRDEAGATPRELLLHGADGRRIPVDLRAAPLRSERAGVRGMVYTLRDCTERASAEAAQQQMAALVESADDAIIIKDLHGVIRSWNPAAQRLLGYRPEEIVGQPITRLMPEDRQDEETIILGTIRAGNSISHKETVRRRKDGTLVDVSLTISPIRDRGGAVVGASKIMRDITERRQYIEQLRHLNALLEKRVLAQTAELRERDALLQEVHHRVKNNLQVISSLINMQIRSLRDESTRSALQQCRSRVETMAQIHEMLYLSKDYANIPFEKYVRELTTRVLSSSGLSPGAIAISHDTQGVALAVDQAIPCALIMNELISNALKHAFPTGTGSIHIELKRCPGERILLAVTDDGAGMPEGFEAQRSGSLGLQLVATLARQLDGQFETESRAGTSFRVTFPYGAAYAAASSA